MEPYSSPDFEGEEAEMGRLISKRKGKPVGYLGKEEV